MLFGNYSKEIILLAKIWEKNKSGFQKNIVYLEVLYVNINWKK